MFQLALTDRENIETLLNPLKFLKPEKLQIEVEQQNKSTTTKSERLAKNLEEKKRVERKWKRENQIRDEYLQ